LEVARSRSGFRADFRFAYGNYMAQVSANPARPTALVKPVLACR